MADTKTSALTSYTTPIATDEIPILDITNTTLKQITYQNLLKYRNASVSTPGAGFAADTYLVGSSIAIPPPIVGSQYHVIFDVVKTAAGTATPIFNIRFGTAGTTSDTSVCAFTFAAATAAVDSGIVEIWGNFRTVGSGTSAVVQGLASIRHALAATGITSTGASGHGQIATTGGGFNSTTASSIIGLSVNGGTSAAWTITNVIARFDI